MGWAWWAGLGGCAWWVGLCSFSAARLPTPVTPLTPTHQQLSIHIYEQTKQRRITTGKTKRERRTGCCRAWSLSARQGSQLLAESCTNYQPSNCRDTASLLAERYNKQTAEATEYPEPDRTTSGSYRRNKLEVSTPRNL